MTKIEHETPEWSGLSKIRLQLREDSGAVTETIEASEHVCSPQRCESPAVCESCGATGAERIILIGSTEDGMDIFVCYPCLVGDDYCRTEREPSRCANSWHRTNDTAALRPCPECPERERAEPVANPETGELVYPWMMPDGRGVDAGGFPTER